MNRQSATDARQAYDAFAASYDDFNSRYMYERWTGKLLERARAAGVEDGRLLDVGCGTGLSFVVPLSRGWTVYGCDISPPMLEQARARVGDEVSLEVADMRALPRLGQFDLIWSVSDAMNYLLSGAELYATLAGMKRNLGPRGVVVFDLNTLAGYRSFWSEDTVVEHGGRRLVWSGQVDAERMRPGAICEARVDGEGPGVEPHLHRQRHFPEAEVVATIGGAGLRCVEILGEFDGELTPGVDEDHHTKAVYVCVAGAVDRRPRS